MILFQGRAQRMRTVILARPVSRTLYRVVMETEEAGYADSDWHFDSGFF
jgi:hypothetical protein